MGGVGGTSCILVWELLGKVLPQPHKFVVDYRELNTVTSGNGYPIMSVHNNLDALYAGKCSLSWIFRVDTF